MVSLINYKHQKLTLMLLNLQVLIASPEFGSILIILLNATATISYNKQVLIGWGKTKKLLLVKTVPRQNFKRYLWYGLDKQKVILATGSKNRLHQIFLASFLSSNKL